MMTTATVAAAALLIKLLGSTDEDSSGSSGSGVGTSSNTAVAEPPAVSNAVATSSSSSLLHARGRDDHHANTSAAAAVDSATTTTPTTTTNTNTDVITSDSTPSTSTTTTTENMICRYFLQGTCRFGPRCHFSHDLSNVENVSAAQKDLGQQHELAKQNAMRQQQSTNTSTTTTTTAEDESEETPSTSTKIHNRMSKTHSDAAALDRQALVDKQRLAWANAPVFVPGRYVYVPAAEDEEEDLEEPLEADGEATAEPCAAPAPTWASIVGGGGSSTNAAGGMPLMSESEVCPFEGPCPYGHNCLYPVHLELCEMCDQYCLHPTDAEQRRKHKKECLQHHEQAMELSFAIARSKDKTCGICFDTIMEKAGREKRFGILPNCSHIFCLECIRKWRQAKQFEHKITRSCPECRIASDFVCPSAFWVETKEEKDKLLNDYRAALGIKDCKYFKKGDGRCPFGNKCFYKHALPNGDLVDVGLPKRARKVLRSSSETTDLLAIYLWEYVDIRDFQRYNMISIESDNDDDDYMRENYDLSLSDVSTDSDLYF